MRTFPLVVGFLLGVAASSFPSCSPPSQCTAATCPLGCCDAAGKCQSASNSTCGKAGSACTTCSVSDSCVMGTCQPGNAGAGNTGAGSAGGGNSGGGSSGNYGAFLTTFANAYCQKAIECGQLPSNSSSDCGQFIRNLFAIYGLDFSGSITELSVSKGTASFDTATSQACLAAVNALQCPLSSPDLAACRGVVRPMAAANGRCFSGGDCTDSMLSCNGAVCMRSCTVGGNLGERCRADGTCTAPFFCSSGVCRNDPPVGTPCQNFSTQCGPRMACQNGACAALPTNGQPCLSFSCAADSYCDSQRICRTRKTAGATCGTTAECLDTLRCSGQVCGPKLNAGGACFATSDCATGLACDATSHCAPLAALGAPCRLSSECVSGQCDDVSRTCARSATVTTGQPCSSTRFCSGFDECRGKVVVNDGGMNTAGTCGAPMLGDRCSVHSACGTGQFCSSTTNGVCTAADGGTPCSSQSNCTSDSYCTPTSICARKAAAGQTCDGARPESCGAPGESCLVTSTAGQFRCAQLPAPGQPCIGGRCNPFAACDQGMCVSAGRQGQPCVDNFPSSCLSGECILPDGGVRPPTGQGGTCQAPRADGAACTSNGGCQSGHCDLLAPNFITAMGVCAAACN